jgi:hypothetical protein
MRRLMGMWCWLGGSEGGEWSGPACAEPHGEDPLRQAAPATSPAPPRRRGRIFGRSVSGVHFDRGDLEKRKTKKLKME